MSFWCLIITMNLKSHIIQELSDVNNYDFKNLYTLNVCIQYMGGNITNIIKCLFYAISCKFIKSFSACFISYVIWIL